MLRQLNISNYALIDSVETEFGPGFSVITGETGAGKSIMLGALSLLLGGRADSGAVRSKERKTVIEAIFSDPPVSLAGTVAEAGCEWNAGELIVRREISPNGRSRSFVNDSPVTLQTLARITPSLIDIHSQHHNLLLLDHSHQLGIIDAMAGNARLLADYKESFARYVRLRQQLEHLRRDQARNRENREFMLFQLEQLDKLKPRKGELAELEREFELFSDAGEIKERLAEAAGMTGGFERSAAAMLGEARASLGRVDLSLFEGDETPGIRQRLESVYIEVKDISETLAGFASRIEDDPARLSKISERMDRIYEALKRFKVADDDALADFHTRLRKDVAGIDGDNSDISRIEEELHRLAPELKEKALALSESRIKAADEFSELLTGKAMPLGLPNLKFSAMVSKGKLTADGMDSVSFLCRFNKNQELMPLEKAASGGEMARLMLCLKEIMSARLRQPTVIFDEIDTGVSGEIADRMGRMMRSMGAGAQVIAITHLPQVASKGLRHYRVFKTDDETATRTEIRMLDEAGRETELAKMLSGDRIDTAAMENARSLLASAAATNPNQDLR